MVADIVLLGSYTRSIHSVSFTKPSALGKRDGTLTVGPSFEVDESPSWVTQHPKLDDILYAVSENEEAGFAFVLKVVDEGKDLKVLGKISTGGGAP
jgi:6-phosphogluconolactonase (cycloisomerase 2 family)